MAAKTFSEVILAILWMIVGVGFYSFTIGNLSSIIADIDVKESHIQEKLKILSEFVKRNPSLPNDLENRIKRFL